MASLKNAGGGLTRRRGMTEMNRLIWVLSRPICASVDEKLKELTGVYYKTSEQHFKLSPSRLTRDCSDMRLMDDYIEERRLFVNSCSPDLVNIANGLKSSNNVSVHEAKSIGDFF